jgi:hypothetical protein
MRPLSVNDYVHAANNQFSPSDFTPLDSVREKRKKEKAESEKASFFNS